MLAVLLLIEILLFIESYTQNSLPATDEPTMPFYSVLSAAARLESSNTRSRNALSVSEPMSSMTLRGIWNVCQSGYTTE